MEEYELAHIVAQIAGKDKDQFSTKKEKRLERENKGAKVIKRKLLGICGWESIKTLEEIAQALHSTRIASSLEEGRAIVPLLVREKIRYSSCAWLNDWYLVFEEVEDREGNKRYRVSKMVEDLTT